VWDIVEFCGATNIFCQGRGSAANSAVCYALGITNADAVALGLLFERFLSPERDGPPDIDIDIESTAARRSSSTSTALRAHHAAQVANVITYRAKSSMRDMAKALGYRAGPAGRVVEGDRPVGQPRPRSAQTRRPSRRHPRRGAGPGAEVSTSPVTSASIRAAWSSATARSSRCARWSGGAWRTASVLQWDKDDCAAAGW
jgi:error-prone DNA polymerase